MSYKELNELQMLRDQVDNVDKEISLLLTQRFYLTMRIGEEKKTLNIETIQEDIKNKRKLVYVQALGSYGDSIYEAIHTESVKQQIKLSR